jgi:hypothetical protein
MRRYILAALTLLTLTSAKQEDFTRVIQTYVTNNEGKIESNVSIEVDNRTFTTGENGVAYLDVRPGTYTIRVYKDSCEKVEQDVVIKDGTAIIQLRIYCPR